MCTVTYDSPEAAMRLDPISVLTGFVSLLEMWIYGGLFFQQNLQAIRR